MFLSKSPSGIYYLYYKNDNGKKQKVSTRSHLKSGALKFLTTFKIEREDRKRPMLFSAFMIKFLEYAKSNLRQGTISLYERSRDLFIKLIGDITLDRLTAYHWDKYKALRLKEVSPVTVNIELRNLRSILSKAYRWGIILKNPFSLQPLCAVPEKYPIYFTQEEFSIFYKVIRDQWFKDVILFAVLTGMRRSEITNLRWRDIDAEKKIIHIQSSPTFRTKSGKKRVMPVHEKLTFIIADAKAHNQDDLVFTRDHKKIHGDYLTNKLSDNLKLTTIQRKGLHFHSLRHTFASWLVQDGVPLYEVQTLMGHSSISVTEIYAHLQPIQLHEAVNRLTIDASLSSPNHVSSFYQLEIPFF